jgi:hypothetical protein
MQWWNEFVSWLNSTEGQRVVTTAILPFVAILVAGILAALIARSFSKRVLAFQDREMKASAITALIGAGRKATSWGSLGGEEKQRVDNQLNEADIRVRLLPMNGASAAADWAAHELAAMKKNSSNYSFQAEQTFVDYRNRLLEWQDKPKRARKLFAFDLEQWRTDEETAAKAQAEKQQQRSSKPSTESPRTASLAPLAPAALGSATSTTTPAFTAPATPAAEPVVVPTSTTSRDDVSTPSASEARNADDSQSDVPAAASTPDSQNSDEYEAPRPFGYPTRTTAPAEPTVVASEDTPTTTPAAQDTDEDTVTAVHDIYAPPINAGTVRQRTDPDPTFDDQVSR